MDGRRADGLRRWRRVTHSTKMLPARWSGVHLANPHFSPAWVRRRFSWVVEDHSSGLARMGEEERRRTGFGVARCGFDPSEPGALWTFGHTVP